MLNQYEEEIKKIESDQSKIRFIVRTTSGIGSHGTNTLRVVKEIDPITKGYFG
ncbi:MAG: hypothetical protein IPI62_14540 [Bacteroidetes bacterium]|nr:hypothetical protein [Bacteroidota bacterium]